jgi:hypothetical protein
MKFLQRTLGRNYKWWYIINYQFKLSSGHFVPFLINTTVRTIEFLIFVYIWKINNSASTIITYLVIGKMFDKLTFCEIEGQISYMVIKVNLTRFLLLPINFFGYMICDNIGFNLVRTSINSFIVFILALLLFQKNIILYSNHDQLFNLKKLKMSF